MRPRGPAGAGAARARGNAQLLGEVGSGASPGARLRGEGATGRPPRGAGGGVAERGLARRRVGGAGAGPGRPRPPRAGRSFAEWAGRWGGVSALTPPPPKASGTETPFCAAFVGLVAAGGRRAPPPGCLRGNVSVAATVGVEPGVELDSPETEQWVKDRFEAWRQSREAGWQCVTLEERSGLATELGAGGIGSRPLRINGGRGKGERNSPHPFACKGEAGPRVPVLLQCGL